MYCVNCGKEIDEEAVICPHCGVATANFNKLNPPQQTEQKNNLFAIFGFSLSIVSILCLFLHGLLFLIALVTALTLSVVGLVKAKNYNSGKGLSIAGVVISAVVLICFIVLMIMAFFLVFSLFFIFLLA